MHETGDVTGLHTMQGVLTVLLVLVCLNVAILVYSRTATRQAEIVVRTALGASRGRIVAQLFIEALVMSALAALAGVAIAAISLRQIETATLHIASELPFWLSFQLMPGAVLYAGVLSVLAAAIVGIVPALKATGRDAQNGLRVIGAGGSGTRLGKTWTLLIVAQVGFAVALLPSAVSTAWGSMQQGLAGLGFPAEEYLSAQLGMDLPDRPEFSRRYAERQVELMRRLEIEPRVSRVTFAMVNPGEERPASIEAQGGDASGYDVRFNRVDLNFFRTFDVPILAGRGFESVDLASEAGTVVVNRTFAEQVFGGDALGRRIRYIGRTERWHEIVGIVPDFPTGASPEMGGSPLRLYHAAAAGQLQPATMAIRVRGGPPSTFAARLQEVASAVDPDLQLRRMVSMDEAMRREQWIRRLEAAVLAAVTLSVLLLSSAGIYALMSITVSQRRKEIGIRTALGADPKRLVASIFSRALGQLAAGAALGMAAAVVLERASGGDLMGKNAAVVLPAVALFMMVVGFLAALGPARRSLRIEPTEALREQ
jgi:predicted permease